ncbi:AAA family ATPase [Bacteriovorax sp. PP10]|uniref:AAA family ATPase n=1 Tax=Bacteriovorax antarcticus TaxID=3088717 RepID=A0ABU5VZK1_9BACT|nr:AAA family ATPase [Bacteriovorax sp. PP10]MEA9358511.1 AAA family ATPase [Bacteriovorax sp. PP10]
MGKIISFINQKGGVGKTTMAFNSAFALAQKGKKVLTIDLDPQANLTLLFEARNTYNLHHLLVNSIKELKMIHVPAMLSEILHYSKGNAVVDLIPGGQELSGFDLTVASINAPRQLVLKKFLEINDLKNRYDYIIIDCPPTLGLLVINALCASDGVIIPFKADDFSAKGLDHFYQVLEDIADMGIVAAPEVVLHVPNLVDLRRKQENDDLTKIIEKVDNAVGEGKVFSPFLNKAGLVKSLSGRKSVFEFKTNEFLDLREKFMGIADKIEEWANVRQ